MIAKADQRLTLRQVVSGAARDHANSQEKVILAVQDVPGFYVSSVTETGLGLSESSSEAKAFSNEELLDVRKRFGDKLNLLPREAQ
ncbi:MAG: hypothetical protein K2Y28_09020 [Burkholderiaceae bacterium]|nr:hypothetical protein [Burkholderiaceae bacterium]